MDNTESPHVEEVMKQKNPLLEKMNRIPGESFILPSKGIFYSKGELEPDVENGQIVIYPMTTLDELAIKSPDMLFQGTAIEQIIARRVPQVRKPLDLLAADVDFILTCMRKISYGKYILIKHKCTSCGEEAKDHEYSIPVDFFINNAKPFDEANYSKMVVEIRGMKVYLKPATFRELISLYQIDATEDDDIEKITDMICKALLVVVDKVDSVKDKAHIVEWLKMLSPAERDKISTKARTLNDWGTKLQYEIQCKDCDKTESLYIAGNPTELFILPSSPEIETE